MGWSNSRMVSLVGALGALAWAPGQASAAFLPTPDHAIVYDTVNNVSWLADVNLLASNRFGLPLCNSTTDPKTCVNASGSMSYQAAAAWVKAMNAANYLGRNNWQIPTTPIADSTCSFVGAQNNSFGWGCSASALGSLYNALGLSAPNSAVPVPNVTVGPFSNFQPDLYWSQTSLPQPTGGVGCCGTFSFNSGWQGSNITSNFLSLLPMIQGKIAGTPPASGTGLQLNPGGQTVYDPLANVTWLVDANVAASNTFGLPACKDTGPKACVNLNGAMNFNSAAQFISNMNATAYLGQTNWQIPPVDPNCAASYLCSVMTAPFQSLYYNQLGLTQGTPVVTAPNIAVGPFSDIRPYLYWTCQANTVQDPCQTTGPATGFEWSFWFGNGFQGTDVLAHDMYVTAYFAGPPASGPCTYSFSSGGQVFSSQGGSGSITINTGVGCPWTVGGLPSWVKLTSPSGGLGPDTLTFQVLPDAGGDISGSFTIAGYTFTVEQQASSIPGMIFIGSMPHLAAEGGWNTTFTLVNKSASTVLTRPSLFDDSGSPLTLPLTFPQQPSSSGPLLGASLDQTLAGNASFIVEASGPPGAPLAEGSAQITATGPVDGFAIFHFDPSQQEAVVPLVLTNAPSYLLAFDHTNGVPTGVAIENISPLSAIIPVVVRDDSGNPIDTESISLPGGGHMSFVLSTQFPETANIRGTVEFDAPGAGTARISVLGIRYTSGTLTTIPALANVASTGGSVAHLASGGGWETTFVLVNTGASAAQAQLSFFDDNGKPLALPLTFPQPSRPLPTVAPVVVQSLAPGASLWIQSPGPLTSALVTGSAQLVSTGNIGGYVIFRYNLNGQEAVVPMENRNAAAYVLAFDNTNGTATGIALSIVSVQTLNVPVTLRDDTGNLIRTIPIPLAANGHYSQSLATLFPETANIRGTLEFDTPGGSQISVIGIRSPPALTFTTLPPLAK